MNHKTKKEFSFVFFGTPEPAVEILDALHAAEYAPALIVTNPDKPRGRKMKLSPSPVKEWAIKNNIPYLQPESLSSPDFLYKLQTADCQLFIVVAYGKIIPKSILNIPEKGTLNIHYSLLPKYRGASPIESQILANDKNAGVSILLLDEKMDHGPIVASEKLKMKSEKQWEAPKASELRRAYSEIASRLLVETLPKWISGKLKAIPQNEGEATYTRKFTKSDGEINFSDDPYKNFLKIRAFDDSIGTYFFISSSSPFQGKVPNPLDRGIKKIRVLIKDAKFRDEELIITSVVPEGKKEMSYNEFLRGLK